MPYDLMDKIFQANAITNAVTEKVLEGLSRDLLAQLEALGLPVRFTDYCVPERTISMTFDGEAIEEKWETFRDRVFRELGMIRPGTETETLCSWESGGSGNQSYIKLMLPSLD